MKARAAGETAPSRRISPIVRRMAGERRAMCVPDCSAAASATARWHDACARIRQDERDDALALLGLHRDQGSQPGVGERRVDVASHRRPGWCGDQRNVGEIGDRHPSAAGEWRRRWQDRHQLLLDERLLHEAVVGHRQLGQPDFRTAAADAARDRGCVLGLLDVHHDAGVGVPERAHERGQWIDGQRRERHDVEPSRFEPVHGGHRRVEDGSVAEELAGRLEERGAGRREHGASSDTVEELHADLALEPGDALGQSGLGDVERVCCPCEGAVVHDADHVLDLTQFHRLSLSELSKNPVGPFNRFGVQWEL